MSYLITTKYFWQEKTPMMMTSGAAKNGKDSSVAPEEEKSVVGEEVFDQIRGQGRKAGDHRLAEGRQRAENPSILLRFHVETDVRKLFERHLCQQLTGFGQLI